MPDRLILPPLRRTARDAEAFARAVHADQVDKAGRPYVEHLMCVVQRLTDTLETMPEMSALDRDEAIQIAWLHDVIEDGKATSDDLEREGFDLDVIGPVNTFLTKPRDASYRDYVAFICTAAPLPALLVKIADTEDNADSARLALLDEPTRARLTTKYTASLSILRAAAEGRRT